jgi:hypothetical protein
MPKPSFELDPREIEEFVRPLPARQRLVFRLATLRPCPRRRGARPFRHRSDALVEQLRNELPTVLGETGKLGEELAASVGGGRLPMERWEGAKWLSERRTSR